MQYAIDNVTNSAIFQNLMKRAGVSSPPVLKRCTDPWPEGLLQGKEVLLGGEGDLYEAMSDTLAQSGAAFILAPQVKRPIFSQVDHYSIPALDNKESLRKVRAIVYDTSHLKEPEQLKDLFHFFHAVCGFIRSNSRMVVLSPHLQDCLTQSHRTTAAAVEGFVRSLAKEMARKGTTVQLLQVAKGEEAIRRAGPVTEFFLSDYGSFITGQVIKVDSSARGDVSGQLSGSLAGKSALVTGAAGGIGQAIVHSLSEEGCHVIALDRPEALTDLEYVSRRYDTDHIAVKLGSEEANAEIIQHIQSTVKKIDIIVHNAGITRDKTLKRMSEVHWNLVMSVNLLSILDLNRELLDQRLVSDFGRIICLSSISGLAGNFGQTNYAATKAGLVGYSHQLARDLRPQGITVNAIAPGFIETKMTERIPFVNKLFARRLASLAQGGLPEDVANAITFLASPESAGINGQVLRVCGGHMMGK